VSGGTHRFSGQNDRLALGFLRLVGLMKDARPADAAAAFGVLEGGDLTGSGLKRGEEPAVSA